MVSKLSDNGIAGFILANGALSGGGEEYKIRRKLIENGVVEAILIFPSSMFYTTDISVSLWIINKNKKEQIRMIGDEKRHFRNREKEIIFFDLRQSGIPFEKKFVQFSDKRIKEIASTLHEWQKNDGSYKDIPEFCYSAKYEEIEKKDFSLVPSKYIEFINRDENIDFDEKMQTLQSEFAELLKAEAQSKNELLKVFEELGYKITV
jgi:type I restriction enzyme M protein